MEIKIDSSSQWTDNGKIIVKRKGGRKVKKENNDSGGEIKKWKNKKVQEEKKVKKTRIEKDKKISGIFLKKNNTRKHFELFDSS